MMSSRCAATRCFSVSIVAASVMVSCPKHVSASNQGALAPLLPSPIGPMTQPCATPSRRWPDRARRGRCRQLLSPSRLSHRHRGIDQLDADAGATGGADRPNRPCTLAQTVASVPVVTAPALRSGSGSVGIVGSASPSFRSFASSVATCSSPRLAAIIRCLRLVLAFVFGGTAESRAFLPSGLPAPARRHLPLAIGISRQKSYSYA